MLPQLILNQSIQYHHESNRVYFGCDFELSKTDLSAIQMCPVISKNVVATFQTEKNPNVPTLDRIERKSPQPTFQSCLSEFVYFRVSFQKLGHSYFA